MTKLTQGNKALRDKNYQQAIALYIEALIANPELSKAIVPNVAMAQQKFTLSREENKGKQNVAVCGWALSGNVERICTLAELYKTFAEVEIIGALLPKLGTQVSESIGDVPVHSFVVDDESLFLEQALKLVLAHPYDVVHLSQPKMPNTFFGLLYKLIWNAKVLIDIDDEELVTESAISIDEYIRDNGSLPELKALGGVDWTRLALGLVDEFDGVIILDATLQLKILAIEKKFLPLLEGLKTLAEYLPLLSNWIKPYLFNKHLNKHLWNLDKRLINWNKKQEHKKIDHELIEELFLLLLGRTPKEHEFSEYKTGWNKYQLCEQLLSCSEGCRYQKEQAKVVQKNRSKLAITLNKNICPLTIKLNTIEKPLVSIIIPVYGKLEYTLQCLLSITQYSPQNTYEVIVVDDQSPDDSYKELSKVKGIRLLRNKNNSGFILSCNKGAAEAKGEYVLFLNNDTKVLSGWLDELVETFKNFPGTGLVGSKLIYPDGRLQEAGGIIWNDASAWNYGRLHDDINHSLFNYAREVDYCSGASIMLPSILFKKLGGFDTLYLPAYYEDTDLAMKVRDTGYRVIYQPLSAIIHFEGITSGTDDNQGVKSYQVKNKEKFYHRWNKKLSHYQKNEHDVDKAKDRAAKYRCLLIDTCTPTPDQDSGSIDAYNILILLRDMGFQVTFIPADNFLYMEKYTCLLQKRGTEVIYSPYCKSVEEHLEDVRDRYELIFLFRPSTVEKNLKIVRSYCPKAKIIFHTVDLHYLRMEREADLKDDEILQREARKMKENEFLAIQSCDLTTVVSSKEQELLEFELPNQKIRHLPYSRSIIGTDCKFSNRKDIFFIGGYQHPPNVDAVEFFIMEIMPLLRVALPKVKFYAAGSNTPEHLNKLACDDVIFLGFVEDLKEWMDKVKLTVAPLRFGAGIKGKIGSALTYGVPTVATSLAIEGMSLIDGRHILIGDTPIDIANHIVKLYTNEHLWYSIQSQGFEIATKNWGEVSAWKKLREILSEVDFEIPETPKSNIVLYKG